MTVLGTGAALVRLVRVQRRQRAGGRTAWPPARSSTTNTAAAAAALGWMFIEWMPAASRPCSAPPPARSPGSWRSRRPPDSSGRWRRSSSAALAGRALLHGVRRSSRSSATTTRSTSSACTAWAARWGALATGLFASQGRERRGRRRAVLRQSGPARGRRSSRCWRPTSWPSSVTWVILKVVDAIVGLRVSDEDEVAGLDLSQHSETAYAMGGGSYSEYHSRQRVRRSHAPGGGESTPGALSAGGLIRAIGPLRYSGRRGRAGPPAAPSHPPTREKEFDA